MGIFISIPRFRDFWNRSGSANNRFAIIGKNEKEPKEIKVRSADFFNFFLLFTPQDKLGFS